MHKYKNKLIKQIKQGKLPPTGRHCGICEAFVEKIVEIVALLSGFVVVLGALSLLGELRRIGERDGGLWQLYILMKLCC